MTRYCSVYVKAEDIREGDKLSVGNRWRQVTAIRLVDGDPNHFEFEVEYRDCVRRHTGQTVSKRSNTPTDKGSTR